MISSFAVPLSNYRPGLVQSGSHCDASRDRLRRGLALPSEDATEIVDQVLLFRLHDEEAIRNKASEDHPFLLSSTCATSGEGPPELNERKGFQLIELRKNLLDGGAV